MPTPLQAFQTEIGAVADGVFGPATMKAAMAHYNWTGPQAVQFFANTSNETGGYRVFSENLDYSPESLLRVWPAHWPTIASTVGYGYNPEKIANRAYANRMGNGDEASGDGWHFRGRGALQTTGKSAYQQVATALNRPDVMTNPDLLADELAFDSATVFFEANHIWALCVDTSYLTTTHVRQRVNGGTIGLANVWALVQKSAAWLGD